MSRTILCKGNNVYANSCWLCSWSLCRRISCQVASSQMHTRVADINMHVCSLACHSRSLSALPKLLLCCVHGRIGSCPQVSPCTFLDCLFYVTAGRPLLYWQLSTTLSVYFSWLLLLHHCRQAVDVPPLCDSNSSIALVAQMCITLPAKFIISII